MCSRDLVALNRLSSALSCGGANPGAVEHNGDVHTLECGDALDEHALAQAAVLGGSTDDRASRQAVQGRHGRARCEAPGATEGLERVFLWVLVFLLLWLKLMSCDGDGWVAGLVRCLVSHHRVERWWWWWEAVGWQAGSEGVAGQSVGLTVFLSKFVEGREALEGKCVSVNVCNGTATALVEIG